MRASGAGSQPPNYLGRAIVLALLVVPLGLLIFASKLLETLSLLTGPAYRSEIPSWVGALMAGLAALVGLMGICMPIAALVKSLQVNSRFARGNYPGAESSSKRALYYSRQSIIFLIALAVIIFTDLFRFLVD